MSDVLTRESESPPFLRSAYFTCALTGKCERKVNDDSTLWVPRAGRDGSRDLYLGPRVRIAVVPPLLSR